MKANLLAFISLAYVGTASAAVFTPKDANNYLDVAGNWTGLSETMAVRDKQLGDQLIRLSTSSATFPATAAATLSYSLYSSTNDFGVGNALSLGSYAQLYVEQGGEMYHRSGILSGPMYIQDKWSGATAYAAGRIVVDGMGAELRPTVFQMRSYTTTTAPVYPELVVTNGASMVLSGYSVFEMFGGWNSGRALFTGEGSSFSGYAISMGAKFGVDPGSYTGYQDKPGQHRTIEFADGAVGNVALDVIVGGQCGGNVFKVTTGATVTAGRNIGFGPDTDDGTYLGCTNNMILVDGGTFNVGKGLYMGRFAASTGNVLEVRNGGKLNFTGDTDCYCYVGLVGGYQKLLIAGNDSTLNLPQSMLMIGGYNKNSCADGNRVEVKDGAKIKTGMEANIGAEGARGNSLSISDGGAFDGVKLCMRGENPMLLADGAALLFSDVISDLNTTTEPVVRLSNQSTLSALRVGFLAANAVFTAADSYLDLRQCFNFGAGSRFSFANSTINVGENSAVGSFGADNAEFALHDRSVFNLNLSSRLNIHGSGFVFRIDDSEVNVTNTTDWYITDNNAGGATHYKYVFEGAAPGFRTTGSGFFLRGTSVELEFNLGADGFSKDRPVVELQNEGEFKADSKSANLITVNVSKDCPSGCYTLLKGRNANTFLNADRYVLNLNDGARARLVKKTEGSVDMLQVRVPEGLAIIVR